MSSKSQLGLACVSHHHGHIRREKRKGGCLLVFVLLAIPITLFGNPAQALPDAAPQLGSLLARANLAAARKDYRQAAALYEEIVRNHPDLAEAWSNLGMMYQFLGDYRRALREFEIANGKEPRLYVPNLLLGIDLVLLHDPGRAIPYLNRAEEIQPGDEQAALNLGQAYEALEDYPKANHWLYVAVRTEPKSAAAWYDLGASYLDRQGSAVERLQRLGPDSPYARLLAAEGLMDQGKPGGAIPILRQLASGERAGAHVQALLGFAYVRERQLPAAEKTLGEELRRNPGDLFARLGIAAILLERPDFTRAYTQLDWLWKADKNFLRADLPWVWQGMSAEELDNWEHWVRFRQASGYPPELTQFLLQSENAWRANRASTSLIPPDGEAGSQKAGSSPDESKGRRKSLAELYTEGHYTQCARSFDLRMAALRPDDLLTAAECAYLSGDYRAALRAGGSLSKMAPRSLAALYWQAKSAEKLAANALMRAHLLAPDSFQSYMLLARIDIDKGRFERAAAEYKGALEASGNSPEAELGLATSYYLDFHLNEAMAAASRVIATEPSNPGANLLMGEILIRLRRNSAAIPYLVAALKGPPPMRSRIHALLAQSFAAQGRTERAIAEWKQALPADPDGAYHYQLYRLYLKAGDRKNAALALDQSLKLRKERTAPPRNDEQ